MYFFTYNQTWVRIILVPPILRYKTYSFQDHWCELISTAIVKYHSLVCNAIDGLDIFGSATISSRTSSTLLNNCCVNCRNISVWLIFWSLACKFAVETTKRYAESLRGTHRVVVIHRKNILSHSTKLHNYVVHYSAKKKPLLRSHCWQKEKEEKDTAQDTPVHIRYVLIIWKIISSSSGLNTLVSTGWIWPQYSVIWYCARLHLT